MPTTYHVSAFRLLSLKDARLRYRLEFEGEVINHLTSLPGSTACDYLARRGRVGWVELTFLNTEGEPDDGKPSARLWAGDIRLRPRSCG